MSQVPYAEQSPLGPAKHTNLELASLSEGLELRGLLREMKLLQEIAATLEYDQWCFLPDEAGEDRAQQVEYLTKLIHKKATAPEYVRLVTELYQRKDDLSFDDRRNIELLKKEVDASVKLPDEFVGEQALAASRSYLAWEEARPIGDFKTMQPHLERLVEFARREADLVGFEEHPYNAHLDDYEPDTKISEIEPVLRSLGDSLRLWLPKLIENSTDIPPAPKRYGREDQEPLLRKICEDLGYDFSRGRLDESEHPFCTGLSKNDIRIATRYEDDYLGTVLSVVHEVGHSLYAQGLPSESYLMPIGEAASMGMDESQSRFLENCIGRSKAFACYLHSRLAEFLPEEYGRETPESIWKRMNQVKAGLIRVDADEVSYNLHVLVRTLLEKDLLDGSLKVKDLPEALAAMYKTYLGVEPKNHTEGVLQDPHWFEGAFGYFPTYALGNLDAACYLAAMKRELPDIASNVSKGNFSEITDWNRTRIHSQGARYPSLELIKRVTGEEFSSVPFLEYVKEKYGLA